MAFEQTVSVQESLRRIHDLQPELNAAVTVIDDAPETGIPVILKDNISTKGIRTTASSKILDNYVPVYDATIVTKLKEAGFTPVAKASMDELGMGGTNRNAATGPVHNAWDHDRISGGSSTKLKEAGFTPVAKASMDELGMGGTNRNAATGPVHNAWDHDRISGGSSGGSAVLAARQAAPLAIGSDTGDSVRKPASYNGVIGVKPTYGRISRYGIIPYASSLDHVGYFTTTVRDAAAALEILAGRDDHDMTSSLEPVGHYEAELDPSLEGKTIAVFDTVADAVQDPVIRQAFADLVKKMEAAGAKIVHVSMPEQLMNLIAPVYKTIANSEAAANHSNLDGIRFGVRKPGESVEDVMTASRTAGFSSYVRARFVIGSYSLFEENQDRLFRKAQKIRRLISDAYAQMFDGVDAVICVRARFVIGSYSLFEENQDRLFRKAQKIRRLISDAYAQMFDGVDAVICPAAPTVAPLLEESSDVRFGQDEFVEEHMQLANFTGYPSMVLPMGRENGLPFAVEIAAKPFAELTMFDVAAGMEEILEGSHHE